MFCREAEEIKRRLFGADAVRSWRGCSLRNANYAMQRTISRSTTFADWLTWSAKGDLIDPGGYR